MSDLREVIDRVHGLIGAAVAWDRRAAQVPLADLRALLAAVEAQRPRPASEPPATAQRVLLRRRRGCREWVAGSYHPVGIVTAETRWAIYGGPRLTDDGVLAWLPLPEVSDG